MTRRPGWVLLDLVAVLSLVGLAVVGLSTTFSGWGFLVVAEVAAAVGLLVCLATSRLPAAVLVAVAPVVAILLGGPVALRAPGLGSGVPDGQTLSDVMQGSFTGWGELLTTLPYVDLAGAPALVPFLLGYVGGVLGGALALRSRSAAGPALPLLAVLVAILLLRRPPEGLLAWHPVGFAVATVAWVALRGLQFTEERSEEIRGNAHGRVLRGLLATGVVGLALLVAVPLTSGNAARKGETLTGKVGQLTDVTELDSPLRNFRRYTEQGPGTVDNLNAKVLLTVEGAPSDARLRLLTLDRYDGRAWVADNHTMAGTSQDRFLRMDTRVDSQVQGRAVRVQIGVKKAYRSAWVPTMGSLTSLRFLYTDAEQRRNGLRYDLATSTAVLPLGLGAGDDYEFTAVLPDTRLNARMAAWPEPVIEVEGARRADRLIRRVLASKAPPMRKVFALAAYLRENGYYSNGSGRGEEKYQAGHDAQRLFDEFLLSRRMVGDDEQYASAMAVLANRVGVPARVVVGALVPAGGKVRGEDIQAWVELRVADGSWRTLPTPEFMGRRPPEVSIPPAPLPVVPRAAASQPEATETEPERAREERARDRDEAARRSLVVRTLPWLVPLLLVGVVPLTKLVRRWRRRTRGRPSDRMAGAWAELVDRARDLGIPVRVHASRPAQARVLARAGALSRQADDGVFAEQEPDEAAVAAYWEQVMGERRTLGEGQSLPRRLWAPFNPVTLIRRPGSD